MTQHRHNPHTPTGSLAGSALPAASACRSAFSPPPSTSSSFWRRAPQPAAVAWSLALVLPGLWLRAYASGYVKKNRELTVTGPYAHTRNPLYLGSHAHRRRLCRWRCSVGRGAAAGRRVCGHLRPRHRLGRALSARHVSRLRRVLPPRSPPDSAPYSGVPHPSAQTGPRRLFPCALLKHREYNAAIGAALLYLSLLFLRPALWLQSLHALR